MGIIKLAPEIISGKMPKKLILFSQASRFYDDIKPTGVGIKITPEILTNLYHFSEDSQLEFGSTARNISYSTPGLTGLAIKLTPEIKTRPVTKEEAAGVALVICEPTPLQMAEIHTIISPEHDPRYRDVLIKTKTFVQEDTGIIVKSQSESSRLSIFGTGKVFPSVIINGIQVKTLEGKIASYNVGEREIVDSEQIFTPKSQTIALIELASPIITFQTKIDPLDLVIQANQQSSEWNMSMQSVILKDVSVIRLENPFITESGFDSKKKATLFQASLVTGLVLSPKFRVAPPKKREVVYTSSKEIPMIGVVFGFTLPARTLQQVWY
ncbi:hypothetical protein [Ewingella americana]|uniref:Uncharacterized protein n=1 Tax=Ewingella americana TaxID=41202 RepID=A0A502GGT9_9GAMM|nr:hypothetical protein [Ewingella americana]TPG59943.1 hypothetical protein EAH77_15360 [Ewingella americana]